MSFDWPPLGRILIAFGIVLILAGSAVLLAPKVPWLGRLPGDVLIQRDRFTFYVPLASCLLASLVVSLVLWLIGRFHR